MAHELAIDLMEQKKDLLYVAGVALTEITLGEIFTAINEYRKKKKQKQASVELRIEAIILDGEPVDRADGDTSAMIALAGDWQKLIDCAEKLGWHSKKGRLLRTSDIVLSISGG